MLLLFYVYIVILFLSCIMYLLLKFFQLKRPLFFSVMLFFVSSFIITKFLINLDDKSDVNSRTITNEEIESWKNNDK